MKFSEHVGSTTIDPTHLRKFIQTWYKPEDTITLIGITNSGPRKTLSFTVKAKDLYEYSDKDIENLTVIETTNQRMDMYITINPTKDDNTVTLYSRGDSSNIREIYGCFVDFDVVKEGKKSGVFTSKEQIYSFLDSIPVPPTIIVDNGINGGVHAYWKIDNESGVTIPNEILLKWWSYISSISPVSIDRLIDITRMSRMPSGIYWPKGDDTKFDTVKVVKNDGPTYSYEFLDKVTQPAYDAYTTRVTELRMQKTYVDTELWNERLLKKIREDNPSSNRQFTERQVKIIMTLIDNYVNNNLSWFDILEPHGWTCLKEKSEGGSVWARPGQSARSAEVDFHKPDGSISHVMSLLSSSPETRLADLKEADVVLSKKQVLLRLKYDDDVEAMVDDLYKEVTNV